MSGGIGVSRRLKPWEREQAEIMPIDFLYLAAVAEREGAKVTLIDLLLERQSGAGAERFCSPGSERPPGPGRGWACACPCHRWAQDLAFANRMKALLPECTVFVFGAVIMATLDHWVSETVVDYVLYGEPEALFAEIMQGRATLAGRGGRGPPALRASSRR